MYTQKERSGHGIHCVPFHLYLWDALLPCKINKFHVIKRQKAGISPFSSGLLLHFWICIGCRDAPWLSG